MGIGSTCNIYAVQQHDEADKEHNGDDEDDDDLHGDHHDDHDEHDRYKSSAETVSELIQKPLPFDRKDLRLSRRYRFLSSFKSSVIMIDNDHCDDDFNFFQEIFVGKRAREEG